VLIVSQKFEQYGRQVQQRLLDAGLRAEGDYRPEKIGAKIRAAQLELIPYMLIVGSREMESGQVSVRDRIEGDLGAMPLDAALEKLNEEIVDRTVRKTYSGDAGLGQHRASFEY
jgi:threonyl-tRNA synthetase